MKISRLDGVLIGLSGLLLVALGICLILLVSNVVDIIGTVTIDLVLGSNWQVALVYIAGALIILWGVKLCVFAVRSFLKREGNA